MITVKTYLDKSDIQGIGVFADENIPMGAIIWQYDPNIDIIIDSDIINKYPVLKRYHWKEKINNVSVCFVPQDNDRFVNHSRNPNMTSIDGKCIAKCDILKGDELLIDYREIMPMEDWADYY